MINHKRNVNNFQWFWDLLLLWKWARENDGNVRYSSNVIPRVFRRGFCFLFFFFFFFCFCVQTEYYFSQLGMNIQIFFKAAWQSLPYLWCFHCKLWKNVTHSSGVFTNFMLTMTTSLSLFLSQFIFMFLPDPSLYDFT